MAGRPKGYPKTGGRVKGVPSKLPTLRQAFEDAFHTLQRDGVVALPNWARANPTDFYRICTRLIPQEIAGTLQANLTVEVRHYDAIDAQDTAAEFVESSAVSNASLAIPSSWRSIC